MKEPNRFWRMIFNIIDQKQKRKEEIEKEAMCDKAIDHGICPMDCDICAWSVLRED